MKNRTDVWKLRQMQQAQPRVLVRMPTSQNIKTKEQPHEKATPKETDAPSDKRDAIRDDFAIPPSFKPDEKRRAAELVEMEMAAIRQEALVYTRPYEGGEGRAK